MKDYWPQKSINVIKINELLIYMYWSHFCYLCSVARDVKIEPWIVSIEVRSPNPQNHQILTKCSIQIPKIWSFGPLGPIQKSPKNQNFSNFWSNTPKKVTFPCSEGVKQWFTQRYRIPKPSGSPDSYHDGFINKKWCRKKKCIFTLDLAWRT